MAEPMGAPPAPLPQGRPRRGGARRWTWLVVVAGVVVVGVVAGGFVLLQNVRNGYYIGAEGDNVVLYRGTPQGVAGVDLSRKADKQPEPHILLSDLPEDVRQRVQSTYTVDGPKDWAKLTGAVCKYSLVQEGGKVVVVKGRGQRNCGEPATVNTSDIQLTELPRADATKITKGTEPVIGRAKADRQLQDLAKRRDQCANNEPGKPKDCPSSGGSS